MNENSNMKSLKPVGFYILFRVLRHFFKYLRNVISLLKCYWWQFVVLKDSRCKSLGVCSLDLLSGRGIWSRKEFQWGVGMWTSSKCFQLEFWLFPKMPQAQRVGKNFQDTKHLSGWELGYSRGELFQRKTWRGSSKPLNNHRGEAACGGGSLIPQINKFQLLGMQKINRILGVLPNVQLHWKNSLESWNSSTATRGRQETPPSYSQGILRGVDSSGSFIPSGGSCSRSQEHSVARLEYQTSFLLPGFDGFLLWAFDFNIHWCQICSFPPHQLLI